jgi:hypothetical protein
MASSRFEEHESSEEEQGDMNEGHESSEKEAGDMMDNIPIDERDADAASVLNHLWGADADDAPTERVQFAKGLLAYAKVYLRRFCVKDLMQKTNMAEKKIIKDSTYSKEYIACNFYQIGANPLDDNDSCTPNLLDYLRDLTSQGKNQEGNPLQQLQRQRGGAAAIRVCFEAGLGVCAVCTCAGGSISAPPGSGGPLVPAPQPPLLPGPYPAKGYPTPAATAWGPPDRAKFGESVHSLINLVSQQSESLQLKTRKK